ncbi:hypothetical protein ACROYT_G042565 [Oculina patagonica]
MRDGTKLAAKLWIPELVNNRTDKSPEGAKYPAILEMLPYRRGDYTAQRDEKTHSYFCSHGYVCVRVDMRGSGDSEGFYYDEYEKQEQDDCCDVISWISQQDWCTGNVGMYGKSWGGFNGLQLAARRPPALKTIISADSTDDRYADDIHYRGGCVLAREMLSWAHIMFLWNARPPHPDSLGPRWKEVWLERLNKSSEPWVHKWLSHQTRDPYWQHGSIAEDFTSIKCPVFLVGGFSDLYTDAVFRMVEHLKCPVRALIGPWSHKWPGVSSPGPRIDHLKESLRWWDCHLKGLPTGIMDEPVIRVFVRNGISNAHKEDIWPGKWIAEDRWPSPNVQRQEFILRTDRGLATASDNPEQCNPGQCTCDKLPESKVSVKSSFLSGSWGGLPLASSLEDLPLEQRFEDALAECWETATLKEPVEVLGFPEIHLEMSCDRPCALVAARLCDVFPNGESSLITRGVLNLTHLGGHSPKDIQPLKPHENFQARVKFDSIAYTVAAGHKIRLALSSVHWPFVWPSPHVSSLSIQTGSKSKLLLPVRVSNDEVKEKDAQLRELAPPDPEYKHAILPVEWRRKPKKTRTLEISQLADEYKVAVSNDLGCVLLKHTNIIYDDARTETFTVKEGEPNTAKVSMQGQVTLKKESAEKEDNGLNQWETRVQTSSEMWSDEQFFYLKSQLTAWHNGEACFDKTWTKKMERFYV